MALPAPCLIPFLAIPVSFGAGPVSGRRNERSRNCRNVANQQTKPEPRLQHVPVLSTSRHVPSAPPVISNSAHHPGRIAAWCGCCISRRHVVVGGVAGASRQFSPPAARSRGFVVRPLGGAAGAVALWSQCYAVESGKSRRTPTPRHAGPAHHRQAHMYFFYDSVELSPQSPAHTKSTLSKVSPPPRPSRLAELLIASSSLGTVV